AAYRAVRHEHFRGEPGVAPGMLEVELAQIGRERGRRRMPRVAERALKQPRHRRYVVGRAGAHLGRIGGDADVHLAKIAAIISQWVTPVIPPPRSGGGWRAKRAGWGPSTGAAKESTPPRPRAARASTLPTLASLAGEG